jgi:hypothetical protein
MIFQRIKDPESVLGEGTAEHLNHYSKHSLNLLLTTGESLVQHHPSVETVSLLDTIWSWIAQFTVAATDCDEVNVNTEIKEIKASVEDSFSLLDLSHSAPQFNKSSTPFSPSIHDVTLNQSGPETYIHKMLWSSQLWGLNLRYNNCEISRSDTSSQDHSSALNLLESVSLWHLVEHAPLDPTADEEIALITDKLIRCVYIGTPVMSSLAGECMVKLAVRFRRIRISSTELGSWASYMEGLMLHEMALVAAYCLGISLTDDDKVYHERGGSLAHSIVSMVQNETAQSTIRSVSSIQALPTIWPVLSVLTSNQEVDHKLDSVLYLLEIPVLSVKVTTRRNPIADARAIKIYKDTDTDTLVSVNTPVGTGTRVDMDIRVDTNIQIDENAQVDKQAVFDLPIQSQKKLEDPDHIVSTDKQGAEDIYPSSWLSDAPAPVHAPQFDDTPVLDPSPWLADTPAPSPSPRSKRLSITKQMIGGAERHFEDESGDPFDLFGNTLYKSNSLKITQKIDTPENISKLKSTKSIDSTKPVESPKSSSTRSERFFSSFQRSPSAKKLAPEIPEKRTIRASSVKGICIYIHMYVYICVFILIIMILCTYVCIYIYIYI